MHLNVLTSTHRPNAIIKCLLELGLLQNIPLYPWASVREQIYCLGRMNFEDLFYRRNFVSCTAWSVVTCKNDVVSSVMEIFVHTEEYIEAYDFANVKPWHCDNKAKIILLFKSEISWQYCYWYKCCPM